MLPTMPISARPHASIGGSQYRKVGGLGITKVVSEVELLGPVVDGQGSMQRVLGFRQKIFHLQHKGMVFQV